MVFFKLPKQKQTIFKLIEIRVVPLMTKVNLDINAFKALASETRLNILKVLDRKKMSLNEICNATNLNKATLHEHLLKLNEAGLVKRKEREGHKWVYYELTWKGSCLLHPENTKIVILFSISILTLFAGFFQVVLFFRSSIANDMPKIFLASDGRNWDIGSGTVGNNSSTILQNSDTFSIIAHDPIFFYLAVGFFIVFFIFLVTALKKYLKNKTPKF